MRKIESNWLFMSKLRLIENPGAFTIGNFLISVTVFSCLMQICEVPYFRREDTSNDTDLKSFFQIIYMIVITFTTIGYGDVYP